MLQFHLHVYLDWARFFQLKITLLTKLCELHILDLSSVIRSPVFLWNLLLYWRRVNGKLGTYNYAQINLVSGNTGFRETIYSGVLIIPAWVFFLCWPHLDFI